MELIQFLGRFHPVVLHLPIGFLVLAYLMQLFSRWSRYASLQPAVGFALGIGMLTAILTTLFGYWLSLEDGYEGALIQQHKWLGIVTTILSVLVYVVYKKTSWKKAYFPVFTLTIIGLLVTGHLGGNITHGEDYLVENLPDGARALFGMPAKGDDELPPIENIEEAIVFEQLVQPVLEKKCVSCHNPNKKKGKLLMHTVEGLQKGGETGPLFVAGDPGESLMAVRINLPKEDDDHMPPSGKQQLSRDERALIEWWIEQGADFEKRVADCEVPEHIQGYLDRRVSTESKVYSMDLPVVKESRLSELRTNGIQIFPIAQNSTLLSARISGTEKVEDEQLRLLGRVGENVVKLDLSSSGITDDQLQQLENFPHLLHLRLDGTPVSDQGIAHLQSLEYLEYLNLYGTQITDASLAILAQLPQLKKLFVWQTAVTQQGAAQLIEQKTALQVSTGISIETMGSDATLPPPLITADKDLFSEPLEVKLEQSMSDAVTYYTLDGATPDSNATRYETPLQLDASTTVKAISYKKNWGPSPIVERHFTRIGLSVQDISLSETPDPKYEDNGPKALIDLTKGTTRFQEGKWLGWENKDVTAILDLGDNKTINGVTVSALEDAGSWIFFPKGIRVSTSRNGQTYTEQTTESYPVSKGAVPPQTKQFWAAFPDPVRARYIKVEIESRLVNPAWHAEPGKPCWVFLDEIIVE